MAFPVMLFGLAMVGLSINGAANFLQPLHPGLFAAGMGIFLFGLF